MTKQADLNVMCPISKQVPLGDMLETIRDALVELQAASQLTDFAAFKAAADATAEALMRAVLTLFEKVVRLNDDLPEDAYIAAMNVDAHPLVVDIADLKIQGFMQSEAACVNGSQICFVLRSGNRIKDGPNLVEAQYGGQTLFSFGIKSYRSNYKCN